MATISYVSAMTPLEAAIKDWHAQHEREVEGLHAKIRELEAQLRESGTRDKGRHGELQGGLGEGANGGEAALKNLKESFLEGLREGDESAAVWQELLKQRDDELKHVREQASRHLKEKQVRMCGGRLEV